MLSISSAWIRLSETKIPSEHYRPSASNADGRTNGMAMPNSEAHQAVMRQAHDNAGLALSETAKVEADGTGTKIGDPIEARAIANCFGIQALYLGAVGEILFLTR